MPPPELLPRRAGADRGPPNFAAALRVDAGRPAQELTKELPARTSPRYGAALFLSGIGR